MILAFRPVFSWKAPSNKLSGTQRKIDAAINTPKRCGPRTIKSGSSPKRHSGESNSQSRYSNLLNYLASLITSSYFTHCITKKKRRNNTNRHGIIFFARLPPNSIGITPARIMEIAAQKTKILWGVSGFSYMRNDASIRSHYIPVKKKEMCVCG